MKKLSQRVLFCILLLMAVSSNAQISYGGKPLPFSERTLKSAPLNLYMEMPAFDIEAELRVDSLTQTDFRSGFRFAYKFMTDFTRANSGTSFMLEDGTKVWRLGIKSANAYSINVLFTEYELPEGARVFLYSPDQTQVLGSFTHLNNSELELLPVAPVDGDELIIEYQEPAGAAFPGRLKVGEVNHAYRDFRGGEPGNNLSRFYCMPSPVCYSDTTEAYNEVVRSVVLLIIDGVTQCSGVLVNNSANDGKPYLLTASHCMNGQFTVVNPDYAAIAGTVVSFFNFESPFCKNVIRGNQEQSMASAHFRAVNEKTDMLLLELMEKPPVYYHPYYAGWNVAQNPAPPFTNVHHPGGSVKRIGLSTKPVRLISYNEKLSSSFAFNPNSFWAVDEWSTGSTAGGSSGSPLFDSNYRTIGVLTGGKSTCSQPKDDVFYALYKSWDSGGENNANLKPWLSPGGNASLQCDGFDPYKDYGLAELSNVPANGSRESAEVAYLPASKAGQQFGVNALGINEYAESFESGENMLLCGIYLVTPALQNVSGLKVDVNVYDRSDDGAPAEVLASTAFSPTYTNTKVLGGFQETAKNLSRPQTSFVKFDAPVSVSSRFFVGYKITALQGDSFTVYSLPRHVLSKNTVWLRYKNAWVENASHPSNPYNAALFVSPVLHKTNNDVSTINIPVERLEIVADKETGRVTVKRPGNGGKMRYEVFSIDGKLMRNGHIMRDLDWFIMQEKGFFIIRIFSEQDSYIAKFVL